MKVIILGLRRSGTTVFWEMFRQDQRLVCFDEPFNNLLHNLPAENSKNTRRELIGLYEKNPAHFRDIFAPIGLEQEVTPELTERQAAYLRWLLDRSEHVVLDSVRANLKVAALHQVAPEAVLVHLHRSPAAFVSSHLLPSGSNGRMRRKVADWLRQQTFWTRTRWYNNWMYEELIEKVGRERFDQLVAETGMDRDRVRRLPAAGKLLAWWKVAFDAVETEGQRLFKERFLSVRFEDYCREPEATMRRIYEAGRLAYQPLDFGEVRPAKAPYDAQNRSWTDYMNEVGLAQNT
jgi:hypothetical protein